MTGKRAVLSLTALLLLFMAASAEPGPAKTFQKSRALMDTFVTITAVSDSSDRAEAAIDRAFGVIDRFGEKIDFFKSTSELSEINRNAGIRPVKVSPETFEVIEAAIRTARLSDGAFDPTIGPIIRLWDFYHKKKPSDAEVRARLPLVNYRNVVLRKERLTVFLKKKGMLLDLGGIAKGFAADLASADLQASGIGAGIVAIAGDIRAFGKKPDGKPWNIGVKNPRQKGKDDELFARVRLTDKAISTAGDYERSFMVGNVRYHHILDPKTGFPASASISVSVISDKGVLSDGFDNAVFVLGPEKGLALVRKMGFDAIMIDRESVLHVTDGLKDAVTIEKPR